MPGASLLTSREDILSDLVSIGMRPLGNGRLAFFAYDLAHSVVVTRQGRPYDPEDVSSMDRDGDGVVRTADLFTESVDPGNCRIPQADEQQRLFVRIIQELLGRPKPIPRLWYFPSAESAVAVVTGDAHHTNRSQVEAIAADVKQVGGRFTLIEQPTGLDSAYVAALREQDHEVEPHIYYQRPETKFPMRVRLWIANGFSTNYFFQPRIEDVRQEIAFAVNDYHARTGLTSTVTRLHFLTWWGWSETAELLSRYGFRMDLSITGLDPHKAFTLPMGNGKMKSPAGYGYINGSGHPMPYVDIRGKRIDLYSQLTIVEDDVISGMYITEPRDDSATVAAITATMKGLIDESVERYHSALVYNFHPEHAFYPFPPNSPVTHSWVKATIEHLAARGVPMLTAREWLDFVEARRAVEITDVQWNEKRGEYSFTLSSPSAISGLTVLLPTSSNGRLPRTVRLSESDGQTTRLQAQRFTIQTIDHASITVDLKANARTIIRYFR